MQQVDTKALGQELNIKKTSVQQKYTPERRRKEYRLIKLYAHLQ
jgi:hypothetical protein